MIEVITGPMFSGKTEKLITKIKNFEREGLKCVVFKPQIESRNDSENNAISTHDQQHKANAISVSQSIYIISKSVDFDVICIDEAQFFDSELHLVLSVLLNNGKKILVSGLDLDYKRKPFNTMAFVMSIASTVTKLTAICDIKSPAQYSKRVVDDNTLVLIGGNDKYIAACHKCYTDKP